MQWPPSPSPRPGCGMLTRESRLAGRITSTHQRRPDWRQGAAYWKATVTSLKTFAASLVASPARALVVRYASGTKGR